MDNCKYNYNKQSGECPGSCSRTCCKGYSKMDAPLHTFDWLADVPGNYEDTDIVEIQFKNTRKGYYRNSNAIPLKKGDIVAVEANPGHDIGTVTLTGRLVLMQLKKTRLTPESDFKRIYRKAKPVDMEKFAEAKAREHDTMIRSRQIAKDLELDMKIGDVEYQGDGLKAIFYYIADNRVDFRQLIKVLADVFKIKIEMKQIGARQEAGRIGGIGPCGRELCCAMFTTNFVSVSTSAARFQDISLNPQKLAGQCAKLKCCLNYEVDAYVEASRTLPQRDIELETKDGTYYFFKADILKGELTYSTDKHIPANLVTISAKRAFAIIEMNKRGERPEALSTESNEEKSFDLLDQENINRFDNTGGKKKRRKGNNKAVKPLENGSEREIRKEKPRQEAAEKSERPERKSGSKRGKGRNNNENDKSNSGNEIQSE